MWYANAIICRFQLKTVVPSAASFAKHFGGFNQVTNSKACSSSSSLAFRITDQENCGLPVESFAANLGEHRLQEGIFEMTPSSFVENFTGYIYCTMTSRRKGAGHLKSDRSGLGLATGYFQNFLSAIS